MSVPQSSRLRFLAEMAEALELAADGKPTESPGFFIELYKNGRAEAQIWHPWKRDVFLSHLHSGFTKGILRVTSPMQFYEWFKDSGDA